MIRLRTMLRAAPALWLSVPLWMLAAYYVTLLSPSDRYAVDATAKATATLPLIGAFCAACAAWEGSRLRRARLWNAPSVRSRLAIAGWCIVPVTVVGLVAVGVAVAHQLIRSGAGLPDVRILAIAGLDLLAYSLAGFAAGVLLPFAVAGPLAIVATIVWLAFVPAVDPPWLRHLTGMFRDCCGLAADLSPRAVAASAIVNFGIVAASSTFVAFAQMRLRRTGAALAILIVAGAGGSALVTGMTFAPEVPRDPGVLECRGQVPTVCTWPEHAARAEEVGAIAASVHARWKDAGIAAPSIFTEAAPSLAEQGSLAFSIDATFGRDDIIGAFATAKLPSFPNCMAGGTGAVAFQYLEAWYAQVGGMAPDEWHHHFETPMDPFPSVTSMMVDLEAANHEVRRDWVSRAEAVSQACDEWPPEQLSVGP